MTSDSPTTAVHTDGELLALATDILLAVGTPAAEAALVAHSLVTANAVGHDSHGVVRLLEYTGFVDRGLVVPNARPIVDSAFGAVASVDGAGGWGQVAATEAARIAGDAAESFGIGATTVRNCNHIGRIGEYAEQLAARGLASIIWCNADPSVAPFGGRSRVLGTNPLAVGIPVADSAPFILDFATSAVAEGKLRVAHAAGESVPEGLLIDGEGRPSTEPGDFYAGGALLPFGGHKGYALSAFIELLGGGLSGNHPSSTSRYRAGNGVVIIALSPEAFAALDFAQDITEGVAALRNSTPIDPNRPVLIPGDVEAMVRRDRADAIPVGAEIWANLTALRARLTA